MTTNSLRTASKLDRAVVASVSAMLAMTVFVFAQQLQATPELIVAQAARPTQQA